MLTGDEPRSIGERLCEAVVPKRPKETPILLKPNLGGFEWFKSGKDDGVKGRITDPEFVRGVIQCLKKRGHTRITVAEGWGATHADWKKLIELDEHRPLYERCQKYFGYLNTGFKSATQDIFAYKADAKTAEAYQKLIDEMGL